MLFNYGLRSALPDVPAIFTANQVLDLNPTRGLFQNSAGTTPAVDDGDLVRIITDQSPQLNTVVAPSDSARGTLKLNVLGPFPAIRFNGSSSWYTLANPTGFSQATFPNGLTIYCVAARIGTPAFGMMLVLRRTMRELRWDSNGTTPEWLVTNGSASLNLGVVNTNFHTYVINKPVAASPAFPTLFIDSINNNVATTDFTSSVNDTVDVIDIGARNGTNFFAGDLVRLLVYGVLHTTEQMTEMFRIINNLYGIP